MGARARRGEPRRWPPGCHSRRWRARGRCCSRASSKCAMRYGPIAAAEMALVRLAYATDLPPTDKLVRDAMERAESTPTPSSRRARPAPAPNATTSRGGEAVSAQARPWRRLRPRAAGSAGARGAAFTGRNRRARRPEGRRCPQGADRKSHASRAPGAGQIEFVHALARHARLRPILRRSSRNGPESAGW